MRIPNHIAFTVDGNRRWAKQRGFPTLEGHKKGFELMLNVIDWCLERGIKTITFYVFSTENWKRSTEEVLGANYIVSESPATLALVFKDIVSGWSKIYTRHDDQRNAQNASEALERLLPWLLGEYCPNFQGRVKRVWAYVRFQSQK